MIERPNTAPAPSPTVNLQQPGAEASRPRDHLSASDEDHRNANLDYARSSGPKAPLEVLTPKGFRPFYPPEPDPNACRSSERIEADDVLNPRGGPSQSLPQQATPLESQQGVMSSEDMADPQRRLNIAATQDGIALDNPANPRGTPDYLVEGWNSPHGPPPGEAA
jgi:hypothetical protein